MAFWEHFPYTNFHEINLDWLCKTAKENEKRSADAVKTAEDAKKYVENVDYSTAANEAVRELYQNGDFETYANYRFFVGKKIVVIGDSNSDENATWGIMPNWVYYMRQKLDGVASAIVNNSISGRRWVGSFENVSSVVAAIDEEETSISTADIVILFAGVNDYLNSSPLGRFNSSDITTFNGSVRKGLDRITAINPRVQTVVISPLMYTEFYGTFPLPMYRMILANQSANVTFINGNLAPGYRYSPNGANYNSIDGLHINPIYAPVFADYVLNQISIGGSAYRGEEVLMTLAPYKSENLSECYLYAQIGTDGLLNVSGTYRAKEDAPGWGTVLEGLPEWFNTYTSVRMLQAAPDGITPLQLEGSGAVYTLLKPGQGVSLIPTAFYSDRLSKISIA